MFGRTTGEQRAQFGRCSTTPFPTPNTLHLPASSHHPAGTHPTRERALPFPSIMRIRLLLIVTYVTAHASDDSNNNPTTINPPLGAVHVPIPAPAHANALANIITATRAFHHAGPDGQPDWNHTAVCNTIRKNLNHPAPYGDIVIALVKYARDSDKRVPSFLFDALADWAPKGQTAQRNPCEDHSGQDARTCVCCASDILTGLRPPEYRGRHFNIPDTLETAMSRSNQ